MAFPQVQSINTSSETTNVTTHTVSLPLTVAANDFLIIFTGIDGSTTVTPPTGWATLFTSTGGMSIFVKLAAGTEGGTAVTFSTAAAEQSAHISIAGDGWFESLTGIEVSTGTTGNSTAPNPDSVTASWGSDDNLFIAPFGGERGDRTVSSFPANYTSNQITNENGSGAAGAQNAICTRELASATDDLGAYTINNIIPWAAATVVIRPGAVAPTGIAVLRRRIQGQ